MSNTQGEAMRERGIQCPACDASTSVVKDSRPREGFVLRRRECSACGHTFGTKEILTEKSDYQIPRVTKDEEAQIMRMHESGMRVVDIASALGRSTNRVYQALAANVATTNNAKEK